VFKALQQSLETITADLVIPMSNLIMEYQTLDNNEKAFKTLEKILGYYNQNPSLALECVVLSLKWKTKSVDYKDFENWFSLLWKGMNSVLLESVLNTFVSNTTFENYSILLDLHLNRPLTCFKDQKEASLFSLKSLVQHCGSAWKPKLASKWSLMLSRLAFICQTACHFIHVQSSLEIIVLVAKTTSYELKPAQLSFMFDLLSNLALNKNLKLTTLEQESLFELLYQVLYTIIRYRREEMLNLIPMFLLHVSAMIDCFAVQDLRKVLDKQFVTNPIVPLKGSLPNQNQAKMISRLLFQMTQKPLSGDSQKLQVIKPFAKHVPFLIFRLLYLQVSTKRNLGDEWKLSMYACLDACDDHGRNMVLAGLESNLQSLRPIYKHVVTEWEKEHRYHGKA
jgi:hypothetical protein